MGFLGYCYQEIIVIQLAVQFPLFRAAALAALGLVGGV
jgi:hypothetical protein